MVPGKKLTGMNTEMSTSEVAMTALVTSAIGDAGGFVGIGGGLLHAGASGLFSGEGVGGVGVGFV